MPESVIHKTFAIKVLEKRKDGGRIVINTASVDRDRDRVFPSGARIDDYLKNPVVQWGHDYHSPWATIGRTVKLEVSPEGIVADFELRPAVNEHDPQAIIRSLWEGEWVRTASIGFMPLSQPKQNEFGGNDFLEWGLLEWSMIPVPSNQDALRLSKALGDDPEGKRIVRLPCSSCGVDLEMSALLFAQHDGPVICFDCETKSKRPKQMTMGEHLAAAKAALSECQGHLDEMADMMEGEEGKQLSGLIVKRGRVLSARNEERLRQALAALQDVLAQLEEQPDGDDKTIKSPPCRQAGESEDECRSRKISEIMRENEDMSREQAVAMAIRMCSEMCEGESEGGKNLDETGERDLANSLLEMLDIVKEAYAHE